MRHYNGSGKWGRKQGTWIVADAKDVPPSVPIEVFPSCHRLCLGRVHKLWHFRCWQRSIYEVPVTVAHISCILRNEHHKTCRANLGNSSDFSMVVGHIHTGQVAEVIFDFYKEKLTV
jgi:hypothetical protein